MLTCGLNTETQPLRQLNTTKTTKHLQRKTRRINQTLTNNQKPFQATKQNNTPVRNGEPTPARRFLAPSPLRRLPKARCASPGPGPRETPRRRSSARAGSPSPAARPRRPEDNGVERVEQRPQLRVVTQNHKEKPWPCAGGPMENAKSSGWGRGSLLQLLRN